MAVLVKPDDAWTCCRVAGLALKLPHLSNKGPMLDDIPRLPGREQGSAMNRVE